MHFLIDKKFFILYIVVSMRTLWTFLTFFILLNTNTCFAAAISCDQAASLVGSKVPPGLLQAIGSVESGHIDQDGKVRPWPFTVDIDGNGYWFLTSGDAAKFTIQALKVGYGSVDVGCFQINLEAHPKAFKTLGEAFDPEDNAKYAADFLSKLYQQTGSWGLAVERYHSANPTLAIPYVRNVMKTWGREKQDTVREVNRKLGVWHGITVYGP